MKYQVQIKYTNPAHEHVSLRRRVDTVNRIVEAASEDEALNRASNQQRALGYLIREAAVVKAEAEPEEISKKKKKVVGDDNEKTDIAVAGGVKEGFDPEPKDIAAHLVSKHGKGKVTKDHVDAYERDRDSNKAIDKEAVMKHVQKMSEEVESVNEDQAADMQKIQSMDKGSMVGGKTELKTHLKYLNAMHTHQKKYGLDTAKTKKKIGDVSRSLVQMGEEVEQVEEGVATAQKVMDRANVVAKTNPDPKKRFAAGGLANKAMMRTINPTGVNTGITRGGGNKAYRKITGKAPPHQLTKKTGVSEEVIAEASKEGKDVMRGMRASLKSMDLRHGVDSDKREAGYKMSPAVKAAQAKSDALSKVVKRPQAGTLAAVHKSMEREMLKKEEVEQVEEGVLKNLKKAHAEYRSTHRAAFGKDPTVKSAIVTGIAKLAGAKTKTARKVGALVGGKPVSKQQQAAAMSRVGTKAVNKMRNEAAEETMTKGKKAAEKMSIKAAEARKKNIEGGANKINMKPTMDLNKTGEK